MSSAYNFCKQFGPSSDGTAGCYLGTLIVVMSLSVYVLSKKRYNASTTDTMCCWLVCCRSPPVKYFTDRSKAMPLLWIIYVISVFFCYAFMHVCLLMPCGHLLGKELISWLSFVMSNCDVVTFPLVSWIRCGA